MLLHYNPDCSHNKLPSTPIRLLCNSRRYTDAVVESARIRARGVQLDPVQQAVLDSHMLLAQLRLKHVSYTWASARLASMAEAARETFGTENYADFRLFRIVLAACQRDRSLSNGLIKGFFDDIPRTVITEGIWRMAQGLIEIQPTEAIPHFEAVVASVRLEDSYCLREMGARFLARNLCALGERDEAVDVLRQIGIPASLAPQQEEIHLNELLVLPLT